MDGAKKQARRKKREKKGRGRREERGEGEKEGSFLPQRSKGCVDRPLREEGLHEAGAWHVLVRGDGELRGGGGGTILGYDEK